MKYYLKLSFLSLFFIISSLTFASIAFAASNTPLGQACTPDSINQDRTCPFCPDKDGSRQVVFDWNFTWSDSRTPLCTVSCSIPSGTCDGALFRDENGYAGGTTLIKPTDKFVIFRDPKVGSTYQASCCVMNNGQCITTPVKSKKMTVTGCEQSCEVPFSEIANAYQKNVPVHVTEVNLKDWVASDSLDQVSWPGSGIPGSGDATNITNIMISAQEQYRCENFKPKPVTSCPVYYNSHFQYYKSTTTEETMGVILSSVNILGLPWRITIRGVDWGCNLIDQQKLTGPSHAVTVLSAEKTAIQGKNYYNFNAVMDPNYPTELSKINDCQTGRMVVTSSGVTGRLEGLVCNSQKYGEIVVYLLDENYSENYSRYVTYKNFCDIPENSEKYKDLCSRSTNGRKITSWLKNNLVSLENPSEGGGNCWGWTDFMLNSAYLGDFVGADYHPDDGKTVNKDCDANHYPIQKSSWLEPVNWLANIFKPMTEMFKLK